MSRGEKALIIFYWGYMVAYGCFVVMLVVTGLMEHSFALVMPLHVFGMFLGLAMLIVVFRDLYKRDFPDPNTKVIWAILMLILWPSILVYLYKHGFRAREEIASRCGGENGGDVIALGSETGNPYQSPSR